MRAGEELWRPGDGADAAFLLDSAEVELLDGESAITLKRGALVGDFDGLLRPRPQVSSARVTTGGDLFRVPGGAFRAFLENNPGVQLALTGSLFVDSA